MHTNDERLSSLPEGGLSVLSAYVSVTGRDTAALITVYADVHQDKEAHVARRRHGYTAKLDVRRRWF